jgi:hypothetical protein
MEGAKNGSARDGHVCTCLRSFTIGNVGNGSVLPVQQWRKMEATQSGLG